MPELTPNDLLKKVRKIEIRTKALSHQIYAGCDAFLSGEIKHHHALAMAESGLVAFECGHFATEFPGVSVLASALQNALCAIECNVRVYVSEAAAYAFPRKK